jgi:hypothetical protein
MFSLLKEIPEIHIGFPYNFYNIIYLSDDVLYGSNLKNLIYDILIFWIIVFIYFQWKSINLKKTTNNKQQT